jgi:hypothetical protein
MINSMAQDNGGVVVLRGTELRSQRQPDGVGGRMVVRTVPGDVHELRVTGQVSVRHGLRLADLAVVA